MTVALYLACYCFIPKTDVGNLKQITFTVILRESDNGIRIKQLIIPSRNYIIVVSINSRFSHSIRIYSDIKVLDFVGSKFPFRRINFFEFPCCRIAIWSH